MLLLKDNKITLNCLAFSPDGKWLAAGGYRGVVQLWDTSTGTLTAKLTGCRTSVGGVFFLSGGAELLVLENRIYGWQLQPLDKAGRRWDKIGYYLSASAVAPDGHCLCAYRQSYPSGEVSCCLLPACDQAWRHTLPDDFKVAAMAFSWDSRTLVLGAYSGWVELRDAADGLVRQKLFCGDCEVKAIALSPDGRAVACAAGMNWRLWRLDPLTEIAHHRLGRTFFLSVAFHPSGRFLATANGDGKVDFWDAHTGQHQKAYDWQIGKLHDVVFDPAGDRAACCSKNGDIVIWDVDE
jgi:WD40 repeat protein